jgi:hypothetical protein
LAELPDLAALPTDALWIGGVWALAAALLPILAGGLRSRD